MRIYMAGGLFTTAEINFNRDLAEQLRLNGHEVFLPQDFEAKHREDSVFDPTEIFKSDVSGVDWCQLVLANMDGGDQDSGTCWELGYGYAKNKYIILYRTDLRRGQEAINIMMAESANLVIAEPLMPVQMLAERIDNEIRARFQRSPISRSIEVSDQFGGFERDPRGPNDKFADAIKAAAGISVKTPVYRHADK